MNRTITVWVVVCMFASVLTLYGQITTATISGAVTDSTGGAIPGAQVTILNEDTGVSRSVQADAGGRYSAPQLSLGK